MQGLMAFSPATLLQAIEGARRNTSVHVRVINKLVILAEWREVDDGVCYYHVLYSWAADLSYGRRSDEREPIRANPARA